MAQAALSEGNTLRAAGRVEEAVQAYRKAVAVAPQFGVGHYNLGIALRQLRDWRGAILSFREAARRDASDYDAMQNLVTTLALAVQAQPDALFARVTPAVRTARRGISVVACSPDPQRSGAMEAHYRTAFGDEPHEIIVIPDARSLCEGYARGLRAAAFDTVVFSHDDVELLSAAPFTALQAALEENDVVGLVGATQVSGPAVAWAGHPHLHGWIAQPSADGAAWDANVFSAASGTVRGAQSLDGLLIAARRDAARRIGFDAATFDGFHFYDLDFSYRAHLAGLRVAITTEISAIHASEGRFDAEWRRYADRFRSKFPALDRPAGPHHVYAARLRSKPEIVRFFDELRGLAQVP